MLTLPYLHCQLWTAPW